MPNHPTTISSEIKNSVADQATITYSIGENSNVRVWRGITDPLPDLIDRLSAHHVAQRQNGVGIVMADLAKGQRLKTAVTAATAVVITTTTGISTEALVARLRERGHLALVYTAFDHGRTETLVAKDTITRWLTKNGHGDFDIVGLVHWLSEVRAWDTDMLRSVDYLGDKQTAEGLMARVGHAPFSLHEVVIPLRSPFIPTAVAATHAEGLKVWADLVTAIARDLDEPAKLPRDALDPARILYLPRRREGAEAETVVVEGDLLDWQTMDLAQPAAPDKPTRGRERLDSKIAALSTKSKDADIEAVVAAIIEDADGPVDEARRLEVIREKIGAPARVFNKVVKIARTGQKDEDDEAGTALSAKAEANLNAAYPPPPPVGTKVYAYRAYGGRPWCFSGSQNGGADRLWTPWVIDGGMIEVDDGGRAGIRVSAKDADGHKTSFLVRSADFFANAGLNFKVALRDAGVGLTEAGEFEAVRQVREVVPSNPTRVYKRPGFRDGAFVTGWGRVIGSNKPCEIAASTRPTGPEIAGDLDGWKAAAKVALESPVLHFGVGVLAGFASPLIDLLGLPTSFVAYTGDPGSGKSTAQELQVSVWGTAKAKAGLFRTFDATPKSNAPMMERASGMGLALDEYKLTDGAVVQHLVFSGATGAGRDRLNRNSELMDVASWALMVTLSGEVSLADKIAGAGEEVAGGLSARAIDLDVGGEPQLPTETMAIIREVRQNFGHAGPAFVQALYAHGHVSDPAILKEAVEAKALKLIGGDASSNHLRASRIVAVLWVAGEVAAKAGLIPEDFDLEALAVRIWKRAQEADTAAGSTHNRALETLYRNLFAGRGGEVHEDALGDHRAAKAWRIDPGHAATAKLTAAAGGGAVYVVPVANLAGLSGRALGHKAVVRALADAGALVVQTRGQREERVWDFVPGLARMRAVVIDAGAVEDAPVPISEENEE